METCRRCFSNRRSVEGLTSVMHEIEFLVDCVTDGGMILGRNGSVDLSSIARRYQSAEALAQSNDLTTALAVRRRAISLVVRDATNCDRGTAATNRPAASRQQFLRSIRFRLARIP